MNPVWNRLRPAVAGACLLMACLGTVHAETYELDKLHTQILFFVDHFGFSKSEGEFLEFDGNFSFDRKKVEASAVEITIDAGSIDMDDDKWNRKMRGKTYFHTDKYPTIRFESTRVEDLGDGNLAVHGDLTILDTTRPVRLDMRLNKTGLNIASGRKTAGFSGGTVLRRSDFGMDSHLKYIGDEVEIRLEVEGSVQPVRKNDS